MDQKDLKTMLSAYLQLTLQGIKHFIPDKEPRRYLYELIADYPNRGGKGFRPGLCISSCKAHGGTINQVIQTAVALELFHNAFLIHDDVEDRSYFRRNKPTMHEYNSLGIAVNLGDAMNVLSMKPLFLNKEILGMRMTGQILKEIEHMVMETVEGQAIELAWRKDNICQLDESDYFRMILKKTCWYTCIHPIRIGAVIGSGGKINPEQFDRLGYFMGVAFQIQDDVLNLLAEQNKYGKEIGGDIIEGKRTLMLIHLLNNCTKKEFNYLQSFLANPAQFDPDTTVHWVLNKMEYYGSIENAKRISKFMAGAALKEFYTFFSGLPDSDDKKLIENMIIYMINRDY